VQLLALSIVALNEVSATPAVAVELCNFRRMRYSLGCASSAASWRRNAPLRRSLSHCTLFCVAFGPFKHEQGLLLVAAANATCKPQTKPAEDNFCAEKCGLYTLPDGCRGTFKVECPCNSAGDHAPTAAPTAAPVGVELPRSFDEFPVVPSGDSGKPSGSDDSG
jgi:hypothetical protein